MCDNFIRANQLLSQEDYASAFTIKAHDVERPGDEPTFMTL